MPRGMILPGTPPSARCFAVSVNCRHCPVARHGESYAILHDELLAALNETTAEHPTARPATAGPTNFTRGCHQ